MEIEKPSILLVLKFYGADSNRLPSPGTGWRSCLCPFHEDTRPSASVNATLEAFNCFTCGVKGDSWKIIRDQEGVSFNEAVRFAQASLGYEGGNVPSAVTGNRKRYQPSWT